jgi:hypothetical protein
MPVVDWDKVDDDGESAGGGGWQPIPPEEYYCKITGCEEKQAKSGSLYWDLSIRVEQGKYAGYMFGDKLFFTQAALPRVKMIFKRFGYELNGKKGVEPRDLVGKYSYITTEYDYYNEKKYTRPTYGGYSTPDGDEDLPGQSPAPPDKGGNKDDLPF